MMESCGYAILHHFMPLLIGVALLIRKGDDRAPALVPLRWMRLQPLTAGAQDGNLDGSPACDIGAYELAPQVIFLPVVKR